MIAKLTGTIDEIKPTEMILDVNGVGYHLHIPLSTYEKIQAGGEASLFVHTLHKEDQFKLFGFHSKNEKELFLILLNVQGIGPSMALSVISGITPELLLEAVRNGNPQLLTKVPGIGKGKSEKLIFELKRKLKKLEEFSPASGVRAPAHRNDAVEALVSLGYDEARALKTVEDVVKNNPDMTLESIIKQALKVISG